MFNDKKEYSHENTIVVSPFNNECEKDRTNDIVIPKFNPYSALTEYKQDMELLYLEWYILAI